MGKTKNVLFTTVFGAAAVASFLLGDEAYRKLIRRTPGEEEPYDEDAQDVWELEALDRTKLQAALFSCGGETGSHEYVLVLRDANREKSSVTPLLEHYQKSGKNVLLPDPRGCGRSTGRYRGYGYDDRLDVIAWIHRILRVDPKAKIALHGLGTGAAAALLAGAEHLPPAVYAVIADSSYTTLPEYLERKLRFGSESILPVKLRLALLRVMTLARAGFDIRDASPLKAVEQMNIPTLFLHGDEDKEIPAEMCRVLYRKAGCTRQIGIFLGAPHLQSMTVSPKRYFDQTDLFLSKQHPDRL